MGRDLDQVLQHEGDVDEVRREGEDEKQTAATLGPDDLGEGEGVQAWGRWREGTVPRGAEEEEAQRTLFRIWVFRVWADLSGAFTALRFGLVPSPAAVVAARSRKSAGGGASMLTPAR